jgi:hypothetical protein
MDQYSRQPPVRARTFAELFGLDESGGRRDNPGSSARRGAAKKTAKRGSRDRSFSGPTPSVGRGAAKKTAKRGAKKSAAKKTAKRGAAKKPGCGPRRAAKNCGPRFVLRSVGRNFTGIWDHEAGLGSSKPRGRYVKRGDLECGSEKGQSAQYTLEMLNDSSLPASKKERRGPWELWLDKSGNWLVYDRRTATLEERTFLRRDQVLRYISTGRAQRDTCPPKGKRAKDKGLARRDNPGYDERDNPARSRPRDDRYAGQVVKVRPARNRGDSLEARVERLETRQDGVEVRVARVEASQARALNLIAGKDIRLGSAKKVAREKRSKRSKRS